MATPHECTQYVFDPTAELQHRLREVVHEANNALLIVRCSAELHTGDLGAFFERIVEIALGVGLN